MITFPFPRPHPVFSAEFRRVMLLTSTVPMRFLAGAELRVTYAVEDDGGDDWQPMWLALDVTAVRPKTLRDDLHGAFASFGGRPITNAGRTRVARAALNFRPPRDVTALLLCRDPTDHRDCAVGRAVALSVEIDGADLLVPA